MGEVTPLIAHHNDRLATRGAIMENAYDATVALSCLSRTVHGK